MQLLVVSGALRPLKWLLGVKWLIVSTISYVAISLTKATGFSKVTILHSEDRASWYILINKPTRCSISQTYLI